MKPEISIIVPIYNKAQYLDKLLNSVRAQTFEGYECILIDDGSTDDSWKICCSVSERDDRFQAFHTSNSGVSAARNLGIKKAQGKYITFADADDWIEPEYLSNLYDCMAKSHADMVVSGVRKVSSQSPKKTGDVIPKENGYWLLDNILDGFMEEQLRSGIFGICVSKLLSREIAERFTFDTNIGLSEDLDYYIQVYNEIQTVYFDQRVYYNYLQQTDNSSVLVADHEIDYLSQFIILTRLVRMLRNRNHYNGNNEKLLEQRLADYAFWTLHYTRETDFEEKFLRLADLIRKCHLQLAAEGIRKKTVIALLKRGRLGLCRAEIMMGRKLRQMIGKK